MRRVTVVSAVEDVARVFNVVAGYDPADPYTEAGKERKEDEQEKGG